ncbi:unnamed protein product, partial [Cuscuta europaea]
MKLTVRQNLDEFQGLMFDNLGRFPTLMSRFRGSVFGRYIDVSFIPVPSLLWPLLSRLAKIDRDSEAWFVVKGVPVRYSITEFALISGLTCSPLEKNYANDFDHDS